MDLVETINRLRDKDDGDRPILRALVAALPIFVLPEIAIVDDLARFREC
jgi:hypothetical protein